MSVIFKTVDRNDLVSRKLKIARPAFSPKPRRSGMEAAPVLLPSWGRFFGSIDAKVRPSGASPRWVISGSGNFSSSRPLCPQEQASSGRLDLPVSNNGLGDQATGCHGISNQPRQRTWNDRHIRCDARSGRCLCNSKNDAGLEPPPINSVLQFVLGPLPARFQVTAPATPSLGPFPLP